MSLSGNKSRLAAISKELSVHWQDTRAHWTDAKAQQFQTRYMLELLARMDKTIGVIEKLDQLLNKVREDCE